MGRGEENIQRTKLSSFLVCVEENLNIVVVLDCCHCSLLRYRLDENICGCYVIELGKLSVKVYAVEQQKWYD